MISGHSPASSSMAAMARTRGARVAAHHRQVSLDEIERIAI
jgi:hypothetical protein